MRPTNRRPGSPTKSRIPEFKSRQEEAEWWDTHDITDYLDELTPVKVKFAKKLSERITIPLDPQALEQLRERACEQGIPPAALAQQWVLERLRETSHRAPSTPHS